MPDGTVDEGADHRAEVKLQGWEWLTASGDDLGK